MKYFILSLALVFALSLNAGKHKHEKKAAKEAAAAAAAQQEKIDAAALAAAYAANKSGHAINCKGSNGGGCSQCNAFELSQQSAADRK